MDKDVLKRLKNAGLLSEQIPDLGFVGTGNYALNRIISGIEYSENSFWYSYPQRGTSQGLLLHDGG